MNPKKIICALILYISTNAAAFSINDKDSLGLPGDNLDLYGVLDLFKKSANPEEFEKALNTQDNGVNNLDLNDDGYIDYIKVIDNNDNNAHALVLQVAVNEKENQDVAVIEIQKNKDGTAHIQIVGDEALYGKNYIVEPSDTETTASQPQQNTAPQTRVVYVDPAPIVMVDVWGWPSVRYMYEPHYVRWVSPWRWSYYPVWFAPWRPLGWGIYYGNVYRYHPYHQRIFVNRFHYAHNIYYGHRSYSPTVYQRRGIEYHPSPVYHQRSVPAGTVNRPRSAAQHPVDRNFQRRSVPAPNQNHNQVRSSAPRPTQQMHSSPRSSGAPHSQGSGGRSGGGHSGGGHSHGGHGGKR